MMYQYPLRYFLVMIGCLSALLIGCTKDNLEIYNRPESLAAPIYQQLDTKGNFKTLLQVIDKSGYKSVLSTGGYWTLFAPSDDAFAKYFTKAGISLSTLDSVQAQKLVQGMLVYNAYSKDKLGDFQKTLTGTGGEQSGLPGLGFRRKTAFSKGYYDEVGFDGKRYKAVGTNASNRDGVVWSFNTEDRNYKHLSYFTDEFMNTKGLTASDYNYFFPNTTYSGFNVMDSKVTEADIFAENGMIHIVDNVPVPGESVDDYLKGKTEYSLFRNLIERFAVFFKEDQQMTLKYNNQTRLSDKVYVKRFDALAGAGKFLVFSPTSENVGAPNSTDSQSDIFSLFVPTNAVLQKYLDEVVLEHYKSLDLVSPGIIIDLVNAHMNGSAIWPSKIQSSTNVFSEPYTFNSSTDVVEKKMLSNGLFYGVNKVHEPLLFTSVYSRVYLDPKYSIMKRLLDMDITPFLLTSKRKFTLFMISDEAFRTAGFTYNSGRATATFNEWAYTHPTTLAVTEGASVLDALRRIVATCVVPYDNGDLTNLSGKGTVIAYNGEPIYFDNNKIVTTGIKGATNPVTIASKKECSNGVAYYTNSNILNYAPVGSLSADGFLQDLEKLGSAKTSPYYEFLQYLKGSHLYNSTTTPATITSIPNGSFYTFMIPDNNAILAAMNAGLLPSTGTTTKTPKYIPTTNPERVLIENFVSAHVVIQNVVPVRNGGEVGSFSTLLKNAVGDPLKLSIETNSASSMTLKDATGKIINVNVANSNNLSNRSLFHSINGYLKLN
ncbi:MAG: fasciclin domain-containing protein [Spirosomataceae bacterium]